MRSAAIGVAAFCSALLASAPASAQRAPASGFWAVGGSFGVSVPSDPSLDKGLAAAVSLEGYLTSRVSVRGQLGGSWWDTVNRNVEGMVAPVQLDGNIVYNWEGGKVHPYVTAGVGMYRYRSAFPGGPTGSDTNAGFDVGGGIEYFYTRRSTVTGEVLYHRVGAFNTPVATFNDGSLWSLAIGLKGYFGR